MTLHILSAQAAPHAHSGVVVFLLVLVFLIVEIPLVFSIFRNGSKDDNGKKMDK